MSKTTLCATAIATTTGSASGAIKAASAPLTRKAICSTMPIAAAVAPGPTVGSAATPAEMATARTTWTLTPAHPS